MRLGKTRDHGIGRNSRSFPPKSIWDSVGSTGSARSVGIPGTERAGRASNPRNFIRREKGDLDPGPKKNREGGVGCIPREKIPSNPSFPKNSEGSGGDPGSRIQGMQIPQREFRPFPREIRRERNRKRLFQPFLGKGSDSTIREKNLGFAGAAPSPPESSREFSVLLDHPRIPRMGNFLQPEL